MKANKIQQVKQALIDIIANFDERTQAGVKARDQMADAINRGEIPSGYRYEFLKDTAYKIVELLGNEARAFDEAHLNDRCTNLDFLDAIETAKELIRQASKK